MTREVALLTLYGWQALDPGAYPDTVEGYDAFLRASGARYFSGNELTTPHHPGIAKRYGFSTFLMPQSWWIRSACCVAVADEVRHRAGKAYCYNHWRPETYNKAVGGAKRSDHINCRAVDLHLESDRARRIAEGYCRRLINVGLFGVRIGLGFDNIHISVLSPHTSKPAIWKYDSYPG